ncbi:MAG: MATE family efflux transporter [Clostridioides sp.]|jgi:putative MATE family efflux protein|nr:MATE family efflux transporter [Clostridioides sp.]
MNTNILTNDKLSLGNKFLRYLIPSVTSMWIFSMYTMVDGIFVSKGVNSLALASVNISMPFINFIFAISLLLSTGASTLIAIYIGKKDLKSASKLFTFSIVTIVCLSIFILIATYLNLDKLAIILGATDSTIDMVKNYLRIIIFFNGFYIVSYSLEVIVKADGFPILATIGVIISALTNIILDYIFVIKMNFGIEGAAYATGISQIFSTLFFISHFFNKRSTLKFCKFELDFKSLRKMIAIGFPDSITEFSTGAVLLLFNVSIQKYIGDIGIVYYSIINYINILVTMTMSGITQALQPISSYYFGAGDKEKINKLFKMGIKTITFTSIGIFILCIIFSRHIVSLFINENIETILEATRVFKIFSFSFLFLGFNILISGFFVSIAKPIISTIISVSRGFIIVSISLFLMVNLFGGEGIWYTTIISEIICIVISIILFRKSKL